MKAAEAALEALEIVRVLHAAQGNVEAAEGAFRDVLARFGIDGLIQVAAETGDQLWPGSTATRSADPASADPDL